DRGRRSDAHLRRVPAGRRLVHAREGGQRARPVDRQADRRIARWPHLGRVEAGSGLDLFVLASDQRAATGGSGIKTVPAYGHPRGRSLTAWCPCEVPHVPADRPPHKLAFEAAVLEPGVVMAPLIRSQFTSFCHGRRTARGLQCHVREVSIAILLLIAALPAQAQERPLEIGVLAFGPRPVPVWSCGAVAGAAAAAQPKQETMPFYIQGMLDGLEKLNYVDVRNEKAGRSGRRVNLDIRMGTFQELQT